MKLNNFGFRCYWYAAQYVIISIALLYNRALSICMSGWIKILHELTPNMNGWYGERCIPTGDARVSRKWFSFLHRCFIHFDNRALSSLYRQETLGYPENGSHSCIGVLYILIIGPFLHFLLDKLKVHVSYFVLKAVLNTGCSLGRDDILPNSMSHKMTVFLFMGKERKINFDLYCIRHLAPLHDTKSYSRRFGDMKDKPGTKDVTSYRKIISTCLRWNFLRHNLINAYIQNVLLWS